MNLNDFVVLPNNKAKSVKLNARNPQELQMATGTLAQESKEIEEQLQQLKESMSKEKEERALPRGFRWKSGQCASLNSNAVTSGVKKDKENRFQKLSSGKLTIRVLKDGLVTAPPPPPTLRDRRKNRLRGTYCGQCEIKTAGLTCAECAEDYCIGCFTKFHQKGALKLHRMIPIQTDLQTHVSTRDVVTCFQKQTNPTSCPTTCAGPVGAKPMQLHSDRSQVSIEDHEEEKKVEMSEEGPKMSFLEGEYNEVESASSFQEALRHWRGEKTDGSGESMREDAMWTPIRPVSVAVMATQADFSPGGGAAGRGRGVGEEKVPVRVEFTENSLTYMDRLLLKKLLRTPVENDHPLLAFGADLKLLPEANTGEETASGLTAQEEDFRHYCALLFEVPVNRGTTGPQITKPEPSLLIEVVDERDGDVKGVLVAEGTTDNNRNVPSVQPVFIEEAPVPQTALTTGSSRASSSSPSAAQCKATAQRNAALQPRSSKPRTLPAERSIKALSSKSKPSARPTPETPRASKTSIKMPNSMSQKPNVHKSNPEHGLAHLSSPLLVHSQVPRSCTLVSGGEEFIPETQSIPSLPSQLLDVTENLPLRVKMEEERELSVDSGDEISTDSLDGAPHEEDSSDEEARMHGRRSREERAITHSEDPFVAAEAQSEKDLPTCEKEQLSTPSMAVHDQNAGPVSEQFCDPDAFPPPGLDMNCGHSDTAEHTRCDPLLTGYNSPQDSDLTESEGYGPSSGLSAYTEEHEAENNRVQPTTIQIHSTRPTSRGEMSTSEFRPLSRAAREIMEVCGVDPSGCEDPDLESDTTAHALHVLEHERRLMAKDTWKQASLLTGDCAGRDPHGEDPFTWGRASNDQNDDEEDDEEEAAAQRDQQSVLLLP
uniref:B box-type domain-containing protein n=1 Tax=Gasterosteus aculeatus aculeatus TaxID=481459 RepID=A0AAQ4S4Y1_GASAC